MTHRLGLTLAGAALVVLGVGLFGWIVFGTAFDAVATSWGGLAGWLVVRLAAFGAVSGGAWLLASRASTSRRAS